VRDNPLPPVQPRVFRAVDGSVAVQDTTTLGIQNDLYELVRIGPDLAGMFGPRLYRVLPSEALHTEFWGVGWVELYPGPPPPVGPPPSVGWLPEI
jgi:hypothetical protein